MSFQSSKLYINRFITLPSSQIFIMVFEWKDEGKLHRVPKLEPGPPNVYFGMYTWCYTWTSSRGSFTNAYYTGDMFCTPDKNAPNPLTGSFFLLEKIDTLEPAPKYDYDESGVVLKGKFTALFVSLFDADRCSLQASFTLRTRPVTMPSCCLVTLSSFTAAAPSLSLPLDTLLLTRLRLVTDTWSCKSART